MIIIQPSGGLCNRMRVINSAYVLAQKRKEKLIILWFQCSELNCPFEDLFQPSDEMKIINIRTLYDIRKLFYQATALRHYTNSDIVNNKTDGILHTGFEKNLKKRVYISTWEHFYPAPDYHLFIPTGGLQGRINQIANSFGDYCIGVHIRRTDNLPSKDTSGTEQFIEAMRKEIEKNRDVTFYLATDDTKEEERLRSCFPDRILSHQNKILDRNSPEGIKDALIDLFCLSRTNKILGSFYSSFTDIAADMNKIPKMIVGKESHY